MLSFLALYNTYVVSASIFRNLQYSMDDEDFPRGKRRKLDADAGAKDVKSTPLDKELFSEVNSEFIV